MVVTLGQRNNHAINTSPASVAAFLTTRTSAQCIILFLFMPVEIWNVYSISNIPPTTMPHIFHRTVHNIVQIQNGTRNANEHREEQ